MPPQIASSARIITISIARLVSAYPAGGAERRGSRRRWTKGAGLKQALLRRSGERPQGNQAVREYARQTFGDTLTLYLHGTCGDIDVETGPHQMASRYLRRLELLMSLDPPAEVVSRAARTVEVAVMIWLVERLRRHRVARRADRRSSSFLLSRARLRAALRRAALQRFGAAT